MAKPTKTLEKLAQLVEAHRTFQCGGFEHYWDLVLLADASGLTDAQIRRVLTRENDALCSRLGLADAAIKRRNERDVLCYFKNG